MMDVDERRDIRLMLLRQQLHTAMLDREGYAIQLEIKERQVEYLVKEIARLEGEYDGSSDGRTEASPPISAGN